MIQIEAKSITKIFHSQKIIDDSSFSINQGDICGIIGPSGSGKTSLLNLITGIYNPTKGDVFFNGNNIKHMKDYAYKVGVGFQECSLYHELSVEENLTYFGRLYGLKSQKIKEYSAKLLRLVELEGCDRKIVNTLSGGMIRRLDIACSILHSPELLVLDEPMQGLDPLLRRYMWQLIQKINKLGMTVIISSHLLNEIEHICSRLVMLKKGHVILEGKPEDIKEKYTLSQEIVLETYPGNYKNIMSQIKKEPYINKMRIVEHRLVVYTTKAEKTLKEIIRVVDASKESLIDVDVNRPSLSEVFEYFES